MLRFYFHWQRTENRDLISEQSLYFAIESLLWPTEHSLSIHALLMSRFLLAQRALFQLCLVCTAH
jgi:hypothetical protein